MFTKGKKEKKNYIELLEMMKKKESVIRDICRLFYRNAIAFNCVTLYIEKDGSIKW